jgi:hypothetical protein
MNPASSSHAGETGVRENRAPDLLGHAALGQNRLALGGVVRERGMNLPIEIVQQRRDRPLPLVFAELPRVRQHARLHCQRVLAQPLRFGELAQNVPSLLAIEHPIIIYRWDHPRFNSAWD